MHPFQKHVNDPLARLLSAIDLDKIYIKGNGPYLFDTTECKYIDFVSGYGALPFGHNPRELWETIFEVHRAKEPNLIQPSFLEAAGQLAARLTEISPKSLHNVIFCNSGAESVEIAIKACRAATSKLGILSTVNSFHGKTLGALSATGNRYYQEPFGAPVNNFWTIPYGDSKSVEQFFNSHTEKIAAIILEPIQGEGGIVVPPKGYLAEVRRLCDYYKVLMILDEVQTGLGRTGRLFACEKENILPDCMTIGKALAGGLIPMAACMINKDICTEDLGLKHSSTFAGNTLGCRLGLRVLELITQDDHNLVKEVRQNGQILMDELNAIQNLYPEVITDVRGEGFLIGVEFNINTSIQNSTQGKLLKALYDQGMLAPSIASYLLNVHKVRTLPTLNHNHVIRIEPSLNIKKSETGLLLNGLEECAELLTTGNSAGLVSHLVGRQCSKLQSQPVESAAPCKQWPTHQSAPSNESRFAFILHLTDPGDIARNDPSFQTFSNEQLNKLYKRFNGVLKPGIANSFELKSLNGVTCIGEFIYIFRTPDEMISQPRKQILSEIIESVNLAKSRGANVIGLGGYTSILSSSGKLLANLEIPITTGNTYTAVCSLQAIQQTCESEGIDLKTAKLAVVGAAGNLASAIIKTLAPCVSALCMIVNPSNTYPHNRRFLATVTRDIIHEILQRLEKDLGPLGRQIRDLVNSFPDIKDFQTLLANNLVDGKYNTVELYWSDQPQNFMSDADIIITATSSPQPFLKSNMIKRGAIICDISVPSNLDKALQNERKDLKLIYGGIVKIPGSADLGLTIDLPPGHVYACMAETMLLALERRYESYIGSIKPEALKLFAELGRKHGFHVK